MGSGGKAVSDKWRPHCSRGPRFGLRRCEHGRMGYPRELRHIVGRLPFLVASEQALRVGQRDAQEAHLRNVRNVRNVRNACMWRV